MDNRFTFKDFVFAIAFVVLIAALILAMFQFSHTENRIGNLQTELQRINEAQKQQTAALQDIRDSLRRGVSLQTNKAAVEPTNANTQSSALPAGVVSEKRPDGSIYVRYPNIPESPRDPRNRPDYAQGDWLVSNLGDEPNMIVPFVPTTATASDVQDYVLQSLITQNPETYAYEPLLAESYEIGADKVTYTFVIRKEAKWSDGKPVTADDVVFTWNTITDPKVDCAAEKSWYSPIKRVYKIDDRTAAFEFHKPYFQSLAMAGAMKIIPKHIYQYTDAVKEFNEARSKLFGSGPYIFGSWDKGQQIVLLRNPNYWGPAPTFNRVVLKFIRNPQASFQTYLAGDIDSFTPEPDQFEKYTNDKDFMAKHTAMKYLRVNGGYRYIGYNQRKPIFKDKLTRQALTQLLDRESMIRVLDRNLAVQTTGPFNPLSPQYDTTIKPWAFNVEEALKKLEQAGWKKNSSGVLERDGVPFTFDVMIPGDSPLYERIANYVKNQWSKAGINANIAPFEFSVLSERLDARTFDAAILGWTANIEGDPYQIWHSDSIAGKGSNYVGYANPDLDKFINEARQELDPEKRMVLWKKCHQIIHEDQPYTFLNTPMSRVFIQNRFQNVEPYKTGLNNGDWYVPASRQKYR